MKAILSQFQESNKPDFSALTEWKLFISFCYNGKDITIKFQEFFHVFPLCGRKCFPPQNPSSRKRNWLVLSLAWKQPPHKATVYYCSCLTSFLNKNIVWVEVSMLANTGKSQWQLVFLKWWMLDDSHYLLVLALTMYSPRNEFIGSQWNREFYPSVHNPCAACIGT